MALSPDGGLVAAGFRPDGRALVAKLDAEGAGVWGADGKGLALDGITAITCLEPSADGGCFIAGTWSSDHSPRPEAQTLFLAAFDGRGNALWRAFSQPFLRVGDAGEYRVDRLLPLADGGCLALGTAHERDGDQAWILRMRPGGSPAWTRRGQPGLCYRNGGGERLSAALQLPDGGFLVLGRAGTDPAGLFYQPHGRSPETWKLGRPYNFVPMTGDGWMLRLDAEGHSLLDTHGYGQGLLFSGTRFADAALGPAGKVYLAGSVWISQDGGSAGALFVCDLRDPRSMNNLQPAGGISSRGVTLDNKIVATDGGGGFTRVFATADGGCLLVGRACPGGSEALQTWAVRFDGRGESLTRSGIALGRYLPEAKGLPLNLVTPDPASGGWILSPRRALPDTPLQLARISDSGDLQPYGDPHPSPGDLSLAAPTPDRDGLRILGLGEAGPRLLRWKGPERR
ncbi:MAG TPA: hypothetical protein VFT46_11690 [Holophagaceae bacterium]|nr:hypothetical protein [Holophagaceae bacterium]